ncbi:MAG: hypothetical protein ACREIU_15535, partial [Planctomycetota bacterium]
MRSAMACRLVVAAALLGAPPQAGAAGSCVAFVDDGVLIVEGDGEGNNVFVTEIGPGVWEVAGVDGTTINGLASDVFSGGIEHILV